MHINFIGSLYICNNGLLYSTIAIYFGAVLDGHIYVAACMPCFSYIIIPDFDYKGILGCNAEWSIQQILH